MSRFLMQHANAVKVQAAEYVQKKQARKVMTRSITGSLAQAQTLQEIADVKFFSSAKAGTFFARDNILECLLFESDDLILRKNEKHVILCLLEVARRGAKFGMLAPMLVQMERQIDREIAADQRALGQHNGNENENGLDDDSDSEMEDEQLMLTYGPLPQIVTNDLKSLDEMVRDLVAKCTCPTQFPMIRVSEGKYRIGDTKVLIFVRILRNHVMVRVGGGWDTLAHYLDKHDPCRCRAQHRTTQSARLVNKPGAMDLAGAHVYYERAPSHINNVTDSPEKKGYLSPPTGIRSRSRSPSASALTQFDSRRSASPNLQRKSLAPPHSRSRSPTPNFTSTHITKLATNKNLLKNSVPQSTGNVLSTSPSNTATKYANNKTQSSVISTMQFPATCKTETSLQVSDHSTDHSDNTSEVSDEGYRSLGLVPGDKTRNRSSLYSQNSAEDAEYIEHQDSIDLEDDTNDMGLRKTHFSEKIYKDNPEIRRQQQQQQQQQQQHQHQQQQQTQQNQQTPARSIQQAPPSLPSRSNSVDRMELPVAKSTSSPRKSIPKYASNINNTWSARPKNTRASLTPESFTSPFNRTSPARRSIASFQPQTRGTQSANTSPTKINFRQQLIRAAKQGDNDEIVIEEVHKLLRQYVSQNSLNEFDDFKTKTEENRNVIKGRKDSRPNLATRIPGPVSARMC
ncbi:Growth-Arrest-Specific Protein 2 Domain [Popillia japonica]|uniref:Growth-Arrest-Specific Protein 2 Domain n=1 Tax=Popillia japonica TaxID=7064 RepID=A0AAW1MJB1_POPJA